MSDPGAFYYPGADAARRMTGLGVFYRDQSSTMHVGLLYENTDGQRYALHLAFHNRLKHDPQDRWLPKAGVVPVDVPAPRLTALAALCERVWQKFQQTRQLPYALRWSGGGFASDGSTALREGHTGFTCATFVLAIFDSAGLPLVKPETWQARPGDEDRQKELLEVLRREGAAEAHVKAVDAEVGAPRFRPEEVAAAGLTAYLYRPVRLDGIEGDAAAMRASLRSKAACVTCRSDE